jgi:hypothetical protein
MTLYIIYKFMDVPVDPSRSSKVTVLHEPSFILPTIISSSKGCSAYNAALNMAKISSLRAILGESGTMKLPVMVSDNS